METDKLVEAIEKLQRAREYMTYRISEQAHLNKLKQELPGIIKELKEGFVEATGQDPWETK